MNARKTVKICLMSMILVLALIGCSDDVYDDYYDDHGQEFGGDQYDGYDSYYGDYEGEYYNEGEFAYEGHSDGYGYDDYGYGDYGMEMPVNLNLKTSDYALGTCGEMEGTTLLVSVFLNDSNTSWDRTSPVIFDALNYTGIATDWISKSVSEYGCNCDFIYDWSEYEDLYYEGTVDVNMTDVDDNADYIDYVAWEFVDNNIDSKALLEKYDADNIGYMLYLNTPKSIKMTSCTRNHYEGMAYPYEMCFIYMFSYDEEEAPAGIAHEILHLFGAPDLYREDTYGDNYGVSKELVDELGRIKSNDIMFTNYDAIYGYTYYDKISNDFTEVDAYYVGIVDSCDFVSEWNLRPSEHY